MKKSSTISFFLYGLTLIFIFCKLTHFIDWSWFWVLSPILIPFILWLIVMMLIGILTFAQEELSRKRIQDMADMQDRVNRKVADDIFNGEN